MLLCSFIVGALQSTKISNEIELNYNCSFIEPSLEKVTIHGEPFTKISMPGSFSIGEYPGTPVFQAVPIKLLLPQGVEVSNIQLTADTIEINPSIQGFDLKETQIMPYQQPVPIGEQPSEFIVDHLAYQSMDQIPDKMYETVGVGYCRGYAILTLNLYPISYIPGEAAGQYSFVM